MTVPHSSRFAGLKDYISQREIRLSLPSRWAATPGEDAHTPGGCTKSWSQWASQKIRRNTTDVATVDEVHLFPSWATKRSHRPNPGEPESEPLGFCSIPALTILQQALSMSCSMSLGSRRLAEPPNSSLAHNGPSLSLPEV